MTYLLSENKNVVQYHHIYIFNVSLIYNWTYIGTNAVPCGIPDIDSLLISTD